MARRGGREGAISSLIAWNTALTWESYFCSTLDNMAITCSVKALGRYLRCPPRPIFQITDCDLKDLASLAVSTNMKSDGNRSTLRATA